MPDLLDWAQPHQQVHVLLSKADKLNRSRGARRHARRVGGTGRARHGAAVLGAQGDGVEEAQDILAAWLA